jgi:hypothetical protein
MAALVLLTGGAVLAKGKPMSPFERAKQNFQRQVSAHHPHGHLKVEPDAEDISGYAEYKTADLYAFAAGPVHGLASADGDVILDAKGLGKLLQHAHFLDATPLLGPKALAERLLFLGPGEMGHGHALREGGRVYRLPGDGQARSVEPPRLERHADGSAALIFFYESLTGVKGMSLHTTPALYRAELNVGKGYEGAKLQLTLLEDEPAAPAF